MDFITTGVIANTVYDFLKSGARISAAKVKENLHLWIKDDIVAVALAEELEKIGVTDQMSEKAIVSCIEQSPKITAMIRDINGNSSVVAPSTVTNVTQSHSGSGDNVAGNKIVK